MTNKSVYAYPIPFAMREGQQFCFLRDGILTMKNYGTVKGQWKVNRNDTSKSYSNGKLVICNSFSKYSRRILSLKNMNSVSEAGSESISSCYKRNYVIMQSSITIIQQH